MASQPVTSGPGSPIDDRPIVGKGYTFASVSDKISSIVLTPRTPFGWVIALALAVFGVTLFLTSVTWLFLRGVGTWGINIPVAWAWDITNFVWWVGIAHAGTLISAVLLLFRQEWRASINRFSEAMTLFAVVCAAMFPILHLGRWWRFYWLMPYPNSMDLWPQFRSPLVWDVFAISTYATVSLLFWYVGLIPDLASLRDRARHRIPQVIYGTLALGWRGSVRHWNRYNTVFIILAGLATPLVASVHTIVSFDFAVSILPGWHTTIFPPYFVAGAIFSGFAMVVTLTVPIRKWYGLEGIITLRHFDNMAKVMIATGLIVAYGYLMEAFAAWYSANQYERYMYYNRMFGPYSLFFAALILCNILIPQTLWIKAIRSNLVMLWVISIIVNVGMWLERFVIIVVSLHRDFIPAQWSMFSPTFWDVSLYMGTIGIFFFLLVLFIRTLPMISIFEMRELVAVKEGRNAVEAGDETISPAARPAGASRRRTSEAAR
jgi:Ni/Fe-hydrogenase subunit HybB-like protein